jgi:hypothetical protein
MHMRCSNPQIRERISLYLWGDLPESERLEVESHLLVCQFCFRQMAKLSPAIEALKKEPATYLRALPPSVSMVGRLISSGRKNFNTLNDFFLSLLTNVKRFALAAVCVLVVVLGSIKGAGIYYAHLKSKSPFEKSSRIENQYVQNKTSEDIDASGLQRKSSQRDTENTKLPEDNDFFRNGEYASYEHNAAEDTSGQDVLAVLAALKRRAGSPYRKIRAIVIGVDDYLESDIPDLNVSADGASRVAALFHDQYPFESITMLQNTCATKEKIIQSMDSVFALAGRKDAVCVFFSGYGYLGRRFSSNRSDYLVPADGTLNGDELDFKNISLDDLERKSLSSKAGHIFFVLNCGLGGSKEDSASVSAPSVFKIDSTHNVLRPVRQVLISAGRESRVNDQLFEPSLLFTNLFIRALEGQADENHDKHVHAEEINRYIRREILAGQKMSHVKQEDYSFLPLFIKWSGDGEFVF